MLVSDRPRGMAKKILGEAAVCLVFSQLAAAGLSELFERYSADLGLSAEPVKGGLDGVCSGSSPVLSDGFVQDCGSIAIGQGPKFVLAALLLEQLERG